MTQLRVLFDAHWWLDGPPSGKAVLKGLVHTWAKEFPDDSLCLRVPTNAPDNIELELASAGTFASLDRSGFPTRNHGLRVVTTRARNDLYDVHFSHNFSSLVGRALRCTFVHDAIFVEHPEWFSRKERAYLAAIRPTLRRADLVFTSSINEAERIARVWPETAERVASIGLAPPLWTQECTSKKVSGIDGATRPYFLAVGRLNARKNLGRLIEAFTNDGALSATHNLVIVGEPDGLAPQFEQIANASVRVLGNITDCELKWLYEHATAMVFPSMEEGFGLPLLEADRFRLPIAASDIPAFREIGVADVYFDPASTTDIGDALRSLASLPLRKMVRSSSNWGDVVRNARSRIASTIDMGLA